MPGTRVLVVDDYPDAADVSCVLLTLLGYDCRIASTGTEALAIADAFHPEIVILDIGLPDITGYDVARALRSRPDGAQMHIAAVTGWGTVEDRARAFEAGFDQHIVKPTDGTKLRSVLRAASERRTKPLDAPSP
ncbi:MAG TPA: response regulator [Kofleriaceae bacterium]|nr:response regulator [Kofleriaceae bacterium]